MRGDTRRYWLWGAVGVAAIVAVLIYQCGLPKPPSPSQSAEPPLPQPPAATPQTIATFVTVPYAEGVPYDEARSFGVAAVPELVSRLNDPSMADAHSNIVVTLGMIGGDIAESELRKVVERGSGRLPAAADFRLRLDALMSLGYAANVAPNDVTLTYLIAGLQSGVWDSRVHWQPPEGGNPFPRLRERTIIALGLTGRPRAAIALQGLLASGGAGGGGGRGGGGGGGGGGSHQLTPADRSVVNEAIRANLYLTKHSLSEYFRDYR